VHVHYVRAETIDPLTEFGSCGPIPDGGEGLLDGLARHVRGGPYDKLIHFVTSAAEYVPFLVHDVIGTAPGGMSVVKLQDPHG
jgi:hypothetical protein